MESPASFDVDELSEVAFREAKENLKKGLVVTCPIEVQYMLSYLYLSYCVVGNFGEIQLEKKNFGELPCPTHFIDDDGRKYTSA